MRIAAAVIIGGALALSACSMKEEPTSYRDAMALEADAIAPPEAAAFAPAAPAVDAAAGGPAQSSSQPSREINIPTGVAQLAYSYQYALEAPPRSVRGLIAAHEKACQAAGPAICQVVGSSVQERGEDRVSGSLEMRAQPAWLSRFRNGLAGDAKSAGGRVAKAATTTEDLSTEIVDTEARLKAMTTLRDRLQALLNSRPGKLQELLEVERELARVQGDIDSATSQLTMMRARVATSAITVEYQSLGVLAPQGAFSPISQAFGDIASTIAMVLAVLIRILTILLPLALVGFGFWWLLRKPLGKLFARRPKGSPAPPALDEKKARSKPSAP